MRKQILIFLCCALIIVGGVFLYMHLYKFKAYENNDTLKAIPADASLIMELGKPNNLANIFSHRIIYRDDLLAFGWFKSFYSFLTKLNSTERYKELNNIIDLSDRSLRFSLHKTGKTSVTPLIVLKIQNKIEEDGFLNFLDSKNNIWSVSTRNYSSSVIYNIHDDYLNLDFYLSIAQGIVICSPSSMMVENSLRQLSSGFSIEQDESFQRLIKTAGSNCDANLFVNLKKLPDVLYSLFDSKDYNRIDVLKKFGDWGEFDLNFGSEDLSVNGFIYQAIKGVDYSVIFDDTTGSSSDLEEVIPENTKFFIRYYIGNNKKLTNNFLSFLDQSGQKDQLFSRLQKITDQSVESVINNVFSLVDDEFGLLVSDDTHSVMEDHKIAVFKTSSKSKTLEKLKGLFKSDKVIQPIDVYKLDDNTEFPIYSSNNLTSFKAIFDYLLSDMPVNYFCFYDNYLVFGNTIDALKQFTYSNVLHRTIDNSKYFKKFSENFSFKDNVFIYSDISKISTLLQGNHNFSLLSPNAAQKDVLEKFYGAGFQLTKAKDLLYLTASIKYLPNKVKEPHTVWQSGLKGSILNKPTLVVNHYTREKEIIVQDDKNFLYLIAKNGKILWQKKLDNSILSQIYQVDYYGNGKLQYIFNTKDRLYILDRNGNNVDRYPLNFASPATNGISLFDYDNNNHYRIFVANDNGMTNVFNLKGKKITGWTAQKTEGIVTEPIQHFRVKGKDYIVFSDDKRNYILDRRGDERVHIASPFIRNSRSLFYSDDKGFLVTTDTNGNLQKINLENGEVKMVKILNETKEHYFEANYFKDSDVKNFIILTNNRLLVCDSTGSIIMDKEYDGDFNLDADIYSFSSNDNKIGLYDEENNLIYLINKDGSLYNNFPLNGTSRFSIGFLSKNKNHFNLIVGGDNNYLYNYRVE